MTILSSSKLYEKFNFVECNREIRRSFVEKLKADPTFPNDHKYHPILIDANFNILDGQHRFVAARELGIPVWYIRNPHGGLEDIKRSNTQLHKWYNSDFLSFYVKQGLPSYVFFNSILTEFDVRPYQLSVIACTIGHMNHTQYKSDFRCGKMEMRKQTLIKNCVAALFPPLNELRKLAGHKETTLLYTEDYLVGLARIWEKADGTFEKIMKRLTLGYRKLAAPRDREDCMKMLLEFSKSKMPKSS